jgi:anaerobic ribonucleoside-triphosphate reductase activating protein
MNLRIAHIEPESEVNGPGTRMVIWFQGCSINCPGCFNPEFQSFEDGQIMQTSEILSRILENQETIEGITFSGGEPLLQAEGFFALCQKISEETNLGMILLTGYNWQQITHNPTFSRILELMDLIIAGPYDQNQRQANHLVGSRNKTLHFLTDRYSPNDLQNLAETEVIIDHEGNISISGIDPIDWL